MQNSSLRRFVGKVVLVTGASTGIGLATIRRLHLEGATVIAAHRRDPNSVDVDGAPSVALDVTDEAQWQLAVDSVIARCGRLDVLINNAGVRASGRIEETDRKLWYQMIDTNLTSIFLGCRACVPMIRAAGGGAIVNVGSITGIRGTENMVAYSASKSGITTLTASLALDLARDNIRVNAVCPASIDTNMVSSWLMNEPDPAAASSAVVAKHPLGRIGRPEEVAGTIAFLASADAGFMTGLSIPVDGGRSIR
ncbi:putative short chain dehydrogenase adh_short [Agrobacterium tumefaciens str. Kerr 14]|uniref:Putative short chain dehydrogenase adh_short n=1 Tax=Agrobacterium tumefaciens str. Kerr 14 TaxID=1183424 RepID=A0A1S7SAQ3_AGRTU|nr:SDR family NAD(P)-dependent oxidoreductase [Agrobacterium tumefaciens]CUX65271.1 putative short chain dehydrogenase adh_short [Agrobacterium tumefaciens str. Kerr 14]